MDSKILKRFSRQIQLPQIGELGQEKLLNGSVLVIGAGGLGCPALQYLAGAGIGKIGIVDFDSIELSNLHRQLIYSELDIGKFKAETAALAVQKIATNCEVKFYNINLDNAYAVELFDHYDIILDCTDQIHIRYLINDACKLLNKPWVYASVRGFEGQWAVFNFKAGPDYRDAFPIPQNPMLANTCELNGIIGMVPGILGTFQALEVVKLLCEIPTETGMLNLLNMLTNETYAMKITALVRNEILKSDFMRTDYLNYVLSHDRSIESNG